MIRVESYFKQAIQIISSYDGKIPFAIYIKNLFSQHKKFGSKDRRSIAALCYSYFRIGRALKEHSEEERLRIAVFLESPLGEAGNVLLPEKFKQYTHLFLGDKIHRLKKEEPEFNEADIFSFHRLSESIDAERFSLSHLVQPDLFIRIRPGKKEKVMKQLDAAAIPFQIVHENCFSLPNGVKLENVLQINADIVIQDLSSQKVGNLLSFIPKDKPLQVWDVCAGSGGKSLLVVDMLRVKELYVSDIRRSILHNLRIRFDEAGLKRPKVFQADLSLNPLNIQTKFDLVICDVPCSGSGTWGRAPENLVFFAESAIEQYNQLQQKIVINAALSVKKNGWFLYSTCSVFKAENEIMASFIEKNTGLKLIESSLIKGYDKKADTLFAAIFQLQE